MWKQDHLTTLTYHNKYIIPMLYKIFQSFADNPTHAVPQALAIASELAISLRRWSNIDNWHAECEYAKTKAQISFAVFAKLISVFVFTTRIVQLLFFLNPRFQASSHLL